MRFRELAAFALSTLTTLLTLLTLLTLSTLSAGTAGALRAQQSPVPAKLTGVLIPSGTAAPVLDGHLDDGAWRAAKPIDDLRQREPLDGTRSWVNVPSGAVVADLFSTRLSWAFTTHLFLNALVQYNGLDEDISANLRFQYIFRPGSDLFLVLNEDRGDPTSLSRLQGRGVRFKVTYLRRL